MLDAEIAARLKIIRGGQAPHDAFVVFAARQLLERLKSDGITSIILSSTIRASGEGGSGSARCRRLFRPAISMAAPRIHGSFRKSARPRAAAARGRITGENLLPRLAMARWRSPAPRNWVAFAIAVCSDENQQWLRE